MYRKRPVGERRSEGVDRKLYRKRRVGERRSERVDRKLDLLVKELQSIECHQLECRRVMVW